MLASPRPPSELDIPISSTFFHTSSSTTTAKTLTSDEIEPDIQLLNSRYDTIEFRITPKTGSLSCQT